MENKRDFKAGWYEYEGLHFFVNYAYAEQLAYWTINDGWKVLPEEMKSQMKWSDKQYGG